MTKWILSNRHAVWALTLGFAIFGAMAYLRLPVQLFPDTAPPLVNVMTAFPGVAAEDVAQDLSRPIEEAFAALEGVVKVRSSSQDNLSLVAVEFHYDRDVDLAAVDVQNAISRIRNSLSQGIREPQVLKFSTTDRPVATFGLRSADLMQTRKLAEDVFAPQLQRINGVAAVDVFGGHIPAVQVQLDRHRMEAAHIPLGRVVESLRANNVTAPAGRIRSSLNQAMFRVDARAKSIADLGHIPIAGANGARVLLADIAQIQYAALDDDSRFRLGGKPAIAMQIFKTSEANTVDVVHQAQAKVAALQIRYPGVDFTLGEESASFTQTSVDNLIGNIWQAIMFTAVLMFLFLRQWRPSLLVALTMPLSFAITFALMMLFGIELNLVTLSAIILAVGIVIDNSVVVLENITRHREDFALSAVDAAASGADEVRGAALGGTLTNIAVLIPLLFLTGFTGKTFGPLALTLMLAFLSSIVVALVLVPLFSIYLKQGGWGDRLANFLSWPFAWMMQILKTAYLGGLRLALSQRWVVVILALVIVIAGVAGIRSLGMDVLPKMDSGSFYVSLETPSASSLQETERVVSEVEALILKEPEVKLVQSQVGFEQGMRSLSSFGVQGPTQGFITVTLSDRNQRADSVWDIEDRIRQGLMRIPNIRAATVREQGNTAKATTSAPIVVRISGDDPQVLDQLADTVLQRIEAVPSVVAPMRSWRMDQRQGRIEVDVLKASQLGVSPAMVGQTLLAGTDGLPGGEFAGQSGAPVPIRVRFQPGDRRNAEDLMRFPLFTSVSPNPVPLSEVATEHTVLGQGLVTREQLAASLEVSAFIQGRPLSFVISDVEKTLDGIVVPSGYHIDIKGEKSDLNESQAEIGLALAIGILAVYLLLVAQFRSFVHPLTVLMSVPLSLGGIALALFLTGKPMSMPVMVGLILIVGTVINSAILLLSFIEQQREQGIAVNQAILNAVALRYRPVMMTSFSTIVGMIPLAAEWSLGAERFSPLAIAVIGGFAASTLLTILVIPVLYSLFDSAGQGLKKIFVGEANAASALASEQESRQIIAGDISH